MCPVLEPSWHKDGQDSHESRKGTEESQPQYSTERPNPRPPRTSAETARIRVKNRRREYLERNPDYFQSAEHEFSDPLLYDELVRKYQTPAEREAEGQAKGYGRVLEGSLLRGEARLAQLPVKALDGESTGSMPTVDPTSGGSPFLPSSLPMRDLDALEAEIAAMDNPPVDRAEATERWQEFLRNRFIRGGDEDFEYEKVDENEEYDSQARRDEEDAWFEEEQPDWASTGEDEDGTETEGRKMTKAERILQGETGVQDF